MTPPRASANVFQACGDSVVTPVLTGLSGFRTIPIGRVSNAFAMDSHFGGVNQTQGGTRLKSATHLSRRKN